MIRLQILGSAEIRTASATITPSQEIAFAAALYLGLERARPVSRARLAALLWPRADGPIRSHRLRQTLLQLKKSGFGVIATRDTVRVVTPVSVDLDTEFDDYVGSSWPAQIDILPGYDPGFSSAFGEWIDSVRERLHAQLLERLIPQLEVARGSGDWSRANRIAACCLELDPYNETALLSRAEGFAMRGQKSAALDLLDRYIADVTPRNADVVIPAKVLRTRVSKQTQINTKRWLVREPEWVGRQKEMLILTGQLSKSRCGSGSACLIKGDAGMGKTRLASELSRFAALQGVRVEHVGCRRSDVNQPLSAFVALVPRLRELPGALGADHESLVALRRLTDFNPSSLAQERGDDDPASVYTNLRAAIFDLLDAVSGERPLLIVIDDSQWLDPTSLTLFAGMLEWLTTRSVLLVFTSRGRCRLEEQAGPGLISVLQLDPLIDSDAQAVVGEIVRGAGAEITAEDFVSLTRASDGNPYFLQEFTKHWIETGALTEVPASVASVLDERISRVSNSAKQLLQACAVLGENSNLDRLTQILELPAYELLASIEELTATGMVRLASFSDASPKVLQVRHDLLANAALSKLSAAAAAFLHRRCGAVLEREVLGQSISVSLLRACAFHWQEAGDVNRAYELSVKCASYLLEIGLAVDASAALEGALTWCSTTDQQIRVLERLVEAQKLAKDSVALLNTIDRIRELQGADTAAGCHDDLEITEFETRRFCENRVEKLFARTLHCVYDKELNPSHRVCVGVVALKIATSIADLSGIQRIYAELRPFLSDSTLDARSRLQVQVIYHTMVGDLGDAVRFAKERIALERAEGTCLELSNAMSDLSFVLRRSGPSDEVPQVLTKAYALAISRKLFAVAREIADKLSSCLVETHEPTAPIWHERAKQSPGEPRQIHTAFSVDVCEARFALSDDRPEDAEKLISQFPWDWLVDRYGLRGAAIALRLRTQIALKADPHRLSPDISELRSLYPRIARLGGQDYEVSSLCAALVYINETELARDYLIDYIAKQRRERTAYSPALKQIRTLLDEPGHGSIGSEEPFEIHA